MANLTAVIIEKLIQDFKGEIEMNTLEEYRDVLKRGDWVLLNVGDCGSWHEWQSCDNRHYFIGYPVQDRTCGVLAVLRPSVIVRDVLNDTLEGLNDKATGHPLVSTTCQLKIQFHVINPKQPKEEPKKSLFEQVALAQKTYDEPKILNSLMLICERIEALEKK